jgi:hypothetical protein
MNRSERYVGPRSNPFWRPGAGRNESPGAPPIPVSAAELTPALLNRLIHLHRPDVSIESVEIGNAQSFGVDPDVISSANRVKFRVRYDATCRAAQLPNDLLLKVARNDVRIGPIYANETRVYLRLSRELGIETPLCLGGAYDPETERYALVLDDLVAAGARFPNVLETITNQHVRSLLDSLARLHARYWQSPRFITDLAWVENHVDSPLARFMNFISSQHNTREAEDEQFKRELIQSLGTSPERLVGETKAVQRHQARLPQTLCHGDAHIGNTFVHRDGRVGFCDWQLTVKGHCMHDVHYLIITSLPVEARRRHERDLLVFYLDRLGSHGVRGVPAIETAWLEYRRAIVWGLWVGWVGTPVVCYGWEVNLINHLRLATAYSDHATGRLVAELS